MTGKQALPDSTDIPIPAEGFVLEELDGELLLFNPQNGHLLELNSTAALVWQLCDGARSVAALCTLLSDAYPDAGPTIAQEVPQILRSLRQLGALAWH